MRERKNRLRACLVSAGAVTALAVVPAGAQAYSHSWGCGSWPSSTRCNDTTGITYNPWVTLQVGSSAAKAEVCVKAVTAAGNLRSTTTGSGNASYCAFNASSKGITLTGPTPNSQGYVYWNGSGGAPTLSGGAQT